MTRGEIIFEISRELGLDDTVDSDELKLMQRWFNRGIVDVLEKTHCYVDEGDMDLDVGVTDYRVDSAILAVKDIRVLSDGQYSNLVDTTMEDLSEMLNVGPAPGPPTHVAIEGTFLRVCPPPSTAVTLRYFYVPRPQEATADGTTADDTVDPSTPAYGGIPTDFHDAILMYVGWKSARFDDKGGGFSRGNAASPGSSYADDYRSRIKEIRRAHRRRAGRGMHAGRIGYPRIGPGARRNDTYPNYTR